MIDRSAKVRGYQEILTAIASVNQLRDAIIVARDGCGIAIPANATQYTAEIHFWLLEHKEMLEQELGLAETVDQYGEPLNKFLCPDCETLLEGCYVSDTEFDGLLTYGTCPDCGKEFVSQDGGKSFEEAA